MTAPLLLETPMKIRILSMVLLCAVALSLVAADGGQGSQKPHVVNGLTLTEPTTKNKPGVARIVAKVDAKDKGKVKVVWDVEATFEDQDVEFDWEVRDNGLAVQVVIPDSRGVIRISAVAIVDGEPTDTRMAKTVIVVDYRPRQPPKQDREAPPREDEKPAEKPVLPKLNQEKKGGPVEKAVRGKIDRVIFVLDVIDGDENVSALVRAVKTKNELMKLDVKPELAPFTSETQVAVLQKLNLTEPIRKAGGPPCAVWIVRDRVRKVTRLESTTKLDDLLKEAAAE